MGERAAARPTGTAVEVAPLGAVVGRNVVLGFTARALEALIVFAATPAVISILGNERYGIVALSLAIISYFAFLDLGMGQALVTLLAEARARNDPAAAQRLAGTAMTLFAAGAVVGVGALALSAAPLMDRAFQIPSDLRREAALAAVAGGLGLAASLVQAPASALLLSEHRSYAIGAVAAGATALRYAALLLVLARYPSAALASLLNSAGLAVQAAALVAVAARSSGAGALRPRWDPASARALLRFGASVTASTFASTFIAHLDKIMIGVFLPVRVLPFYAVPFSLASRLWEIPQNIARPAWPAFAQLHAARGDERLERGYVKVARLIMIGAAHPSALLVAFAPEVLGLWVGEDFAREGATVLRLLAVGMLLSAAASAPLALANAIGRPGIPARVHAFGLLLDVALCLALVPTAGIAGAAVAWVAVHVADLPLMTLWAHRAAGVSTARYARAVFPAPLLLSAAVAALTTLARPLATHLVWLLLLLGASLAAYYALCAWLVLTREEAAAAREAVGRLLGGRR